MSRWKSPKLAARLAQREVEKAERLRRERWQSILLVCCIATVSIGLMIADFLWLRHNNRQRQEQHEHSPRHKNKTNAPVSAPTGQNPKSIDHHE